MRQALLISIWQSSAIHLLASSPLKLCQVGSSRWTCLGFLQKYLIGFKLRLWLGHSRTCTALCRSHSCCVFRVIVLLEGKPSAHQRFWMLWTGFSLTLSQYFGALSFSSILMSPSVPAAEKQPHSTRSTLYFWDGTLHVMSRAAFLQTWCLELRFIRPDNIIYLSLGVL